METSEAGPEHRTANSRQVEEKASPEGATSSAPVSQGLTIETSASTELVTGLGSGGWPDHQGCLHGTDLMNCLMH